MNGIRRNSRRRGSRLARRLLSLQLVTVLITVGGMATLGVWGAREVETDAAERLTRATATSVATDPQVIAAVAAGGDPFVVSRTMQPLAERVRIATGTAFVVVMSPQGIRYSHAEPDRIGGVYVGSTAEALAGRPHSEHFLGTLGPSIRTVVPVVDGGRVVGLVSVGVLENRISALVWRELPWILLVAAAAVVLGGVLAWLLARRVRRQTLGLEPEEIAAAYAHHDAVLHAVREGLVVLDPDGRVVVANAEARRLLGWEGAGVEGRRLAELGVDPALRAVVRPPESDGSVDVRDSLALAGERVLLVSRTAAGERAGAGTRVVTLRDRTEVADALRQRDAARDRARALAGQAHEFANRMQTVLTLVQLGDTADALRAGTTALDRTRGPAEAVLAQVQDPVLAAVLVDKAWVAAERDVAFTVTDTTEDGTTTAASPDDLVTLLGNLVDNALDAVTTGRESDPTAPAEVRVRLATEDDRLVLEVADTGPGVPPDAGEDIFEHGFSTKPAAPDRPRGIGLALVSRVARRLGGTVDLRPGSPGTVFTVRIPAVRPGPLPSPPSVPTASAGPPPPA